MSIKTTAARRKRFNVAIDETFSTTFTILAKGTLQYVIAAQFSVHRTTINDINTGHRWANI